MEKAREALKELKNEQKVKFASLSSMENDTIFNVVLGTVAGCLHPMKPFTPSRAFVHSYQNARIGESMSILSGLWGAALQGDISPANFPCLTSSESLALRCALEGGERVQLAADAVGSSTHIYPLGSSSYKVDTRNSFEGIGGHSGLNAVSSSLDFREKYEDFGRREAAAERTNTTLPASHRDAQHRIQSTEECLEKDKSGVFCWPSGPEFAIKALRLSSLPQEPQLPSLRTGYTQESLQLLGSLKAFSMESKMLRA